VMVCKDSAEIDRVEMGKMEIWVKEMGVSNDSAVRLGLL
jgi:hypothetical protein